MKSYILFIAGILCLVISWNLESLPLYYPYSEPGFFADAAVEGICVENPEVNFYGLVSPVGAPAANWDTDCLGTRLSGSAGWKGRTAACGRPLRVTAAASYSKCDFEGVQNLENESEIQLFAINGGGVGGTIPSTQNNLFHFSHEETEVSVLASAVYCWFDGIILYPAVGYGYICHNQAFSSQLVNFELNGFNNGTIHETLDTSYHGANFELGIAKRCCRRVVFSVVPFLGIYSVCAELDGVQNWGENPLPVVRLDKETMRQTAYRGGIRSALLWECRRCHIGVQAFVDYLSFVPGLFNPREDDEGPAAITRKNSLRYGGGLVVGTHF